MAKKDFPDLTGDGKVTRADVLKGRGVFQEGGEAIEGQMDDLMMMPQEKEEVYYASLS